MLLEGLQLPLTTPFYPDGRLNLPKLEHNVARYSKTPVAGLVALSDFGEPTMLSDEETRQTSAQRGRMRPRAEKVLMAGCRAIAWRGRSIWRRLLRSLDMMRCW